MDSGAIKTVASPVAMPVSRRPETSESITRTELPAERTVTPVKRSEQTRRSAENTSQPANDASKQLEHKHYRDAITNDVVYRAIDPENGEVVHQVPEESLLRLRRFFAAYDELSRQVSIDKRA